MYLFTNWKSQKTRDISPIWPTPSLSLLYSLCSSYIALYSYYFSWLQFCATLFLQYPVLNSSTQTIKSPLSNNFTASLSINIKHNPSSAFRFWSPIPPEYTAVFSFYLLFQRPLFPGGLSLPFVLVHGSVHILLTHWTPKPLDSTFQTFRNLFHIVRLISVPPCSL